jgi:hypothetical protein
MERIWGPVNGFYYAAYAEPVGDGDRFCSYAKVCWNKPESYWEADCAFKLFGGEEHTSPEIALASVAHLARNETARLPPQARTIADQRRRDNAPVLNLLVSAFFRRRIA